MRIRAAVIAGVLFLAAAGLTAVTLAQSKCIDCGAGDSQALYVDDDSTQCPCAYPGPDIGDCGRAGKPYSCIADAVRKISPGGTIFVADGTYHECVEISRSGTAEKRILITATRAGGAVISRDPSNPACVPTPDAVSLKGGYVTLSGFQVTGGADGGAGIRVGNGAAWSEITGVAVHRNDVGVLVEPTAGRTTIKNSKFYDNDKEGLAAGAGNAVVIGVQAYGNRRSGILLQGSGSLLIDSLSYSNFHSGVTVSAPGATLNGVEAYGNGGNGVTLTAGADRTTVTGLLVHNNGAAGLVIASNDNSITRLVSEYNNGDGLTIAGSFSRVSMGRVSYNTRGVRIIDDVWPFDSPTGNSILSMEIDHSRLYDGLKLDRVGYDLPAGDPDPAHGPKMTTIENCHIHHNYLNGIYEHVSAAGTVIRGCEIDNNGGKLAFAHGVYLGGSEGLLAKSSLHHNSNYGIQLWPSPRGTAGQHYLIEKNEMFANGSIVGSGERRGGGIVLGGGPLEAPPQYPQWPQYVEVRYNVVHHNVGAGVVYTVGPCGDDVGCDTGDRDNLIHHNTVYGNGRQQLTLTCANGDKLRVVDNFFIGSESAGAGAGPTLVGATRTSMASDALDGNLYGYESGNPDSSIFRWNGLAYSFNALKSPGVRQSPTCAATVADDPLSTMESHSSWSSLLRFIDPGTSLRTTVDGVRHGDYHLRTGSAGMTGGVCSAETSGGQDIDDEDVPETCAPSSFGVGADYHRDSDADGVADRFDCAPYSAIDASVCDDDPATSWEEAICVARGYAGALYDPAVHPGAPENCDGKDNDCDGALLPGGEADADYDGVFTCGGDCDDNDPRVFPGAHEFCDGKDNDCNGVSDEGVSPGEATSLLFSSPGTLSWVAPPAAISHALYRGTLRGGAWVFDHACLRTGLPAATATDTDTPARGAGFYYLASGRTACGEESLGSTSATTPRPNAAACP